MPAQAKTLTEVSVLKADRAVRQALLDCLLILLLISIWSFYMYVLLPVLFRDGPFPSDASSGWIFLIALFIWEIAAVYRYIFMRGLAKKRTVALNNGWQASMTIPSLPGEPLTAPLILTLDSRARFIFWGILSLLILSALPIVLEYWIAVSFLGAFMVLSFSPLVWPAAMVFVGLLIALFLLLQGRLLMRLELTPGSVACRYLGKREALSWKEIQMFACYTWRSTEIYEVAGCDVSGKLVIVRWRLGRRRLLTSLRPSMTFEEYASLPARLNSSIAAKTQLPLLDLNARTTATH